MHFVVLAQCRKLPGIFPRVSCLTLLGLEHLYRILRQSLVSVVDRQTLLGNGCRHAAIHFDTVSLRNRSHPAERFLRQCIQLVSAYV